MSSILIEKINDRKSPFNDSYILKSDAIAIIREHESKNSDNLSASSEHVQGLDTTSTLNRLAPDTLDYFEQQARRDDWHTRFSGSDIRLLIGEIRRLQSEQKGEISKDTLIDSLCAILYPIAWVEESTQEKHREDMRKTARSALAILPNSGEISAYEAREGAIYEDLLVANKKIAELQQREILVDALENHIRTALFYLEGEECDLNTEEECKDLAIKTLRTGLAKIESSVIDEGTLDKLLNAYEVECINYGLHNSANTDALQMARKTVVKYINAPKREQGEISANDNALFNILMDVKKYLLADKKEPALGRINYALLHITKPIQQKRETSSEAEMALFKIEGDK